jgi:hypothetical protein
MQCIAMLGGAELFVDEAAAAWRLGQPHVSVTANRCHWGQRGGPVCQTGIAAAHRSARFEQILRPGEAVS